MQPARHRLWGPCTVWVIPPPCTDLHPIPTLPPGRASTVRASTLPRTPCLPGSCPQMPGRGRRGCVPGRGSRRWRRWPVRRPAGSSPARGYCSGCCRRSRQRGGGAGSGAGASAGGRAPRRRRRHGTGWGQPQRGAPRLRACCCAASLEQGARQVDRQEGSTEGSKQAGQWRQATSLAG